MTVEVELISGRTLDQGATVEEKLTDEYFKAVSYCELSEEDFKALGLSEGDRVKVKTEFGEVVVFAVLNKDLDRGMAFIPMGPYANMVIDPNTDGTGMPQFKGVKATVEKTDEKVLNVKELVEVI
ncbi:formylmethanofuran dehydrogenase, subunit D [Archaeoglobus sulfaticallidus PM70-1]|uniref:Formylmethanofuran dehydrogenase, subunit D n=1 Tax=Archaeoglobus sulfaticallidus PM70-1 TaxID=387631 RepID=N0BD86_9EURY|nr:molybdopterin dinucleotide binding domain-containing protein [Archaeoglobus sulfaticallidus]AGK61574.1 formylmethanofuran dehydrogenase, subunit D [Archaeoglobus sulfaticallidus PM70-1]